MQYTAIFHENFQSKMFDISRVFAQNIDCRYTLEPPFEAKIWVWTTIEPVYPQFLWGQGTRIKLIQTVL